MLLKNKADLQTVLKELHHISGFRISLYDTNFHEIAAYPTELTGFCSLIQKSEKVHKICVQTDTVAFEMVKEHEQAFIYQCKFGLYEAVAPLYYFGVLSGYLMMGQALPDQKDSREHVFDSVLPYCSNHKLLREEIGKIPSTSREKILSCISIMNICAEYITITNRLNPTDRNLAHSVRMYLNQNFKEKITIELLCSRFFCSKSTLNHIFKQKYKKTVIHYLNEVRLKHALELLENSRDSIYLISQKCGFTDQNYFTKVFSTSLGVTPTQYRKNKEQSDEYHWSD